MRSGVLECSVIWTIIISEDEWRRLQLGRGFGKNTWALVLIILSGIVLGGFFGFGAAGGGPLVLELGVITLQFGFTIRITIASILGMIAAVFIYRKL